MGSTPRGIPFPDPSTPPRRQALEDLATGADTAIGAALGGTWQAYTPTWTASTNPNIGNGTIAGFFRQFGKTTNFRVSLSTGSTTTFGSGQYQIGIPAAAATGTFQDVVCEALISGALYRLMGRIVAGGTSVLLYADPTTAGGPMRAVTSTVPATFTSTSQISINGTYEAA